jgi:leucyl-tRNA synthetase
MGFDAFGLPAEQYAIEHGIHPVVSTENNIKKTCNSISYNELLIRISNWDKIIEEE